MSSENIFLPHLRELEPDATFDFTFPRVTSSSGTLYFAKFGSSPSDAEQYEGEAESLRAIHLAAPGLAPRVLASGVIDPDGRPYFLSEYKAFGQLSNASAAVLGRRMATELHMFQSTRGFGFHVPTYCGVTKFSNGWFSSWEMCFDSMIGEMLDGLKKKGRFGDVYGTGTEVRNRVIPWLLGPLVIQPVLLHGDLWSGNCGQDTSTGQPLIFDPASYFGHNEADLAIARMFGGIPQSFFTSYHEHHAKTHPVEQYELRADLYELFHYLNHTLIFGSSYAGGATQKMRKLLAACP